MTGKFNTLFGAVKGSIDPYENFGVMLLGEANREAPAQAELRPTCAGAYLRRGLLRQPSLSLNAYEVYPGLTEH